MSENPKYEELKQRVEALERETVELKRSEQSLKEKERFLESMFDAIQDGIIVLDRDLTVVRVNRWMEKKYASEMPLTGKKCYTVFQKRQDPCIECPCIIAFEKGKLHSQVLPYPSAQSPTGWFEVSAFRLKDVDGKVTGAIEHVKDITKRKRIEKEREKLIKELQEALKEIKTLRGILPLCSFCKKIRDDKGYWEQVDVYIHKHSQADISHGICPECMKKHYPDIDNYAD